MLRKIKLRFLTHIACKLSRNKKNLLITPVLSTTQKWEICILRLSRCLKFLWLLKTKC